MCIFLALFKPAKFVVEKKVATLLIAFQFSRSNKWKEVKDIALEEMDAAKLCQYGIPFLLDEELEAAHNVQNQTLLEELNEIK